MASNRRWWLRENLGSFPEVQTFFVVGDRRKLTAEAEKELQAEQLAQGDFVTVHARDYVPYAVAEKTLSWYLHASEHVTSEFIAKMDDDTYPNMPLVLADIGALRAVPNAFYGVLRWRLWEPAQINGACGPRGDDNPPRQMTLRKIRGARQGGECKTAEGPYPFGDGSLQVMARSLLRRVMCGATAAKFKSYLGLEGDVTWRHEDAGIGFIVYNETRSSRLSTSFVTLTGWRHVQFWLNVHALRAGALPMNRTLFVHRIKTDLVADAVALCFPRPSSPPSPSKLPEPRTSFDDLFRERECSSDWGWPEAPTAVRCFNRLG